VDNEEQKSPDPSAKGMRENTSRGDKTPLELFLDGLRDWEGRLRRHFEDPKPKSVWLFRLSFPGKSAVGQLLAVDVSGEDWHN